MPMTGKPKLTVLMLAIIAFTLATGPSAGPAMAQASVPAALRGYLTDTTHVS